MSDIKNVTNINWGLVGTGVVTLFAIGAVVIGVRMLPSNRVTQPIKEVAEAGK